ncbi:MAG: hypothetical protein M1823_002204 [Watsoniomyces obsoletus]|nr:MAG: hypothetical protein M1823_002204 [Watsoniomyces obsoletus]
MVDIRNFFGSKGGGSSANIKPVKKERVMKKEEDDDDDDPDIPIRTRKRKTSNEASSNAAPNKKARTPLESNTVALDDDEDEAPVRRSSGRKSATPAKKASSKKAVQETKTSPKDTTRHRVSVKQEDDSDDDDMDIEPPQPPKGKSPAAIKKAESSDEMDEDPVPPPTRKTRAAVKVKDESDDDDDDDFEMEVQPLKKPSPKRKSRSAVKVKDDSDDDDDDFEMEVQPLKKPSPRKKAPARGKATKKMPPKKASPKKPRTPAKNKKPEVVDSKEIREILDSIPTVAVPEEGPQSTEPQKFDFRAHAQRTAPPPGAGSKDIPIGNENCLAGLSFVFTGVLDSLGREEGQELVKRYGGKVVGAPSKKTDYVVLGTDAGPKKIATIRQHNIKTINEDGLFELIRRLPANGGDSSAAAKYEETKAKEAEKIREMAAEMERQERRQGGAGGQGGGNAGKSTTGTTTGPPPVENRLWTVKYAPSTLTQICGNKGQVEKLQRWLREWPKNQRIHFKKAGPDGSGCFRAIIIHGPPGVGKTTAAHLIAKLEGFDIIESNASDARSKKLVEKGLQGVLDNNGVMGYFASDNKPADAQKKKLVLIMDEVDGMSAGDRGGVGALAQVCKKTNIPMILICNERRLPKMKPFDFVAFDLAFRRPTVNDIRSRIASICFREGLKLPTQVIDALIEGTHADIRQIINMISTAKLDQEAMSFDQGKSMSKAWEKHIILKPWDIVSKILSPAMFGANSNKTLNDKVELYFNDHEFSHLMLQENYLKPQPSIANRYQGKEKSLKLLELMDKAAESISDGDLVDRMIHGPQQHWSLMPTHAMFSFVRPASFVYGNLMGQTSFTSWLGQNSKQGKLSRFVKEIQGHMRLRASGDRHEVRQQYLPTIWTQTVGQLESRGREAVDDVIKLMDSYFLTKEDYDAIIELGLGPMDEGRVKIDTQTKATFTRLYNLQSHPLPFMKASNILAPSKKLSREKPDLEEAIDESDDNGGVEEDSKEGIVKQEGAEDDEDLDLSKDKYVKQPKKKRGGAATTGAAGKKAGTAGTKAAGKKPAATPAAKKRKTKAIKDEDEDEDEDVDMDDDDDEESDEEDIKPRKGAAAGRGARGGAARGARGGRARGGTTKARGRGKK